MYSRKCLQSKAAAERSACKCLRQTLSSRPELELLPLCSRARPEHLQLVGSDNSSPSHHNLFHSFFPVATAATTAALRNCIDIGELGSFGHPVESTDVSYYFSQYVTAVDGFKNAPYYDTALIDGRFRVACAIKTLRYLRRDSLFFMHDWPRSYQKIDKYADLLATHGSFAVLAPKANLTAGADMDFEKYRDVI